MLKGWVIESILGIIIWQYFVNSKFEMLDNDTSYIG